MVAVGDEADFFANLDLNRPDLAAVKAAVAASNWDAAKAAWAVHLASREAPRWLWTRQDRPAIQRAYDLAYGGLGTYAVKADAVLARHFTYGGVSRTLTPHVDWRQGPGTWTQLLNRHSYFQELGYAYWASGDVKYAADYVRQLTDWVTDNPVPTTPTILEAKNGTPWRTLEAGVRAHTWLDSAQLFMDAPQFDAQAKYVLTKSLVEHARYLTAHASVYRPGNWQVVECSGLAQIGIMLPEFKEAAGWRERGLSRLAEHMNKDVMADGGHYEITPGYHAWVAQQFMTVSRLGQLNGYRMDGLMRRQEKMFEWLMAIDKPNGHAVPLGDGGTADGPSVANSMADGAALFGRPDMRALGSPNLPEASIWLLGPQAFDNYRSAEATPPTLGSCLLLDSQLCVMRTGWQPSQSRYLLFSAAPRRGAHSHDDALEVVLYAGRDLLLDPGIYNYDQPLCTIYLRKSEAHNVLTIDGLERVKSTPKVLDWTSDATTDFARAERIGDGIRQERSVLFVKPNYWVIVDRVEGQGAHDLRRLFHFPAVRVECDQNSACTTFGNGENVRVTASDGAAPALTNGYYPTAPATAVRAPVAQFLTHATLPVTLCTLISVGDNRVSPTATLLKSDVAGEIHLRVTGPDGEDDIRIAPDASDQAGGNQGASRAVLVHKPATTYPCPPATNRP
ncbi:MAG: alginate lyase family protein [Tepidisphaeraceae bacterium]